MLRIYWRIFTIPSSDVPRVHLDSLYPRREEEVVFTSPLTIKVYEEVKEKRMEEVDLETGRRRSYVEEVRYEVLDLTGDTPGRRGSQRAPLQPLPSQNSEAAKTTKTRGRQPPPPPPTKSPLGVLDTSGPGDWRFPDLSVLCLSSPTPTRGAAPSARVLTPGPSGPRGRHRTAGTQPGLTDRRPRTAVTTKYPLLR